MLLEQKIKVRWHNQTKDWYVSKGYTFTKIKDEFEVDVKDLSHGTHKRVLVQCDYCNKIYDMDYASYCIRHEDGRDACQPCTKAKREEKMLELYGTTNAMEIPEFKAKMQNTFIEKYGVDNPFKLEECKDKAKQTCMERFGTPYASQCEEIKSKVQDTCMERYGVPNVFAIPEIAEKNRQSCIDKFGVEYAFLNDEVREKARHNYMEGDNTPCSKKEKLLCDMVSLVYGEENIIRGKNLNDKYILDCELTLDGNVIDIEYDGWYWHSSENAINKDKKRNAYMKHCGIKVLRIRTNKMFPTKEQIIEAVDYLVKGNHDYTEINLDI